MELKGKQLFEKVGDKKYLYYCLTKKEQPKHQKIIALFCLLKDYRFETYEQLGFFFNRYLKAAKRLEAFPVNRIRSTIKYLLNNKDINFKVGLETVEKYIMDVSVPEQEVIIKLKNGEEVNSAQRLKELEKLKIIYYQDGKWHEYC